MAAGDIYQLTITGDIDGQQVQNVLHFKETVASSAEIPARDVIDAWYSSVGVEWAALLSAAWQATSFYARRVKPTPAIPYLQLAAGDYVLIGQEDEPVCPTTAAFLFSLYTNTASKRGRGRIYLAGVPESSQDAGQINPATEVQMQALAAKLDENFVGGLGGEWDLAVYSRIAGTAQKVIEAIAHTNLATQRSRRAYPGLS